MILKLEKEIHDLNSALDSLKEAQTSQVEEHFNVSDTSVEKIEKVECITFLALKLEIENIKGQLTHVFQYLLLVIVLQVIEALVLRKPSCH